MGLLLGLDVGGSKTRALLVEDGREVAEATGASANIASVGEDAAREVLAGLFQRLGPARRPEAICVGTAGGDLAERLLAALVAETFPGVPLRVVHDTHIILAAAGLSEGVAVISGTGSSAWGRRADGRQARAGGWGHLLGDEGSGYGVAREALRHLLDRGDQGLPPDELGRELMARARVGTPRELYDLFYADPSRRRWARESQAVFELADAGDEVAGRIAQDAAAELVRASSRVALTLGLTGPVVLAGGLVTHQPLLQRLVREGLEGHGVTDVRVLALPPVLGAVRLAEDLAGEAATG